MLFIRSFNRFINSKTGHPLPDGSYRGEYLLWDKFETLFKEAIVDLGYDYYEQLETPLLPATADVNDIQICAHKTKRDIPDADFFYMQMHLKELFTLDTKGWGADHSKVYKRPFLESIDIKSAEALRLRLLKDFLTSGASKHPQPKMGATPSTEDFDLERDYIFVPLQTPRDYVLKHHAEISVVSFIKLVAEWAIAQKVTVCFKLHPYSLKDLKIKQTVEQYAIASQFVNLSSRNIHELIDAASGIFVINSGVGFEGLIHGKPVVTFGNCDYKIATFSANPLTIDPPTLKLAGEYVQSYSPQQKEFASQFVYHYYTHHAFSLAKDFLPESKLRLTRYLQDRLPESSLNKRLHGPSLSSGGFAAADFSTTTRTPDDASDRQPPFDVVYVLNEDSQSWILGAICREIDNYHAGSSFYYKIEDEAPLPPAKTYFFVHYSLWYKCLNAYPWLRLQQTLVFFTHPQSLRILDPKVIQGLNQASKIICMCSVFREFLIKQGVAKSLLKVCILGADRALFQPHNRGSGVIGFCSAFYARKNPDLIVKIIQHMPHRKFLLLGRNWQKYEQYEALMDLDNLSYIEADYADYPEHYAKMDVFVSASKLEGGPIPLIEAMMCNAVPVASDTGFARDIIVHGETGFIFDIDESVEAICSLIEQAYALKINVSSTVEHLTWERFSFEIQALFQPDVGDINNKLAQLHKHHDLANQRIKDYEQLRSQIKKVESENRKLKANLSSLKYLLSKATRLSRHKIKKKMTRYLKPLRRL